MILFVPFAAIFKLIADRMQGWETISLLLGEPLKENEKEKSKGKEKEKEKEF
jgi:hypothetical protein